MFVTGRNLRFLYIKINDDLANLSQWFKNNSLSLNIEKSSYIVFSTKNKRINYNSKIEIDGKEVKRVFSTKFLGIYIDKYLDWDIHINYLLSELVTGIYSLNMTKNVLPPYVKINLYLANVEAHLRYALCIWGPMINTRNRQKLKIQQNKAIRAIFRLSKQTALYPYYKKAEVLTLEDLIDLSLLQISYRYINDTLPKRISNLFEIQNHHVYFTRNRNNLITPIHTLQIYNTSFLGKAPHIWLHSPQKLKNSKNKKVFAKLFSVLRINNYI